MSDRRVSIPLEEPLLSKWRTVARESKRLHDAARSHFKKKADASLISAVVLGSAGGLMNILLGVIDPTFESVINISQIVLGACSVMSVGIMSTSKQLGWESKVNLHEEYSTRYSEIVRMINTEATLSRLNDSSFASTADFIKTIQAELDRIEDHAPPIPSWIEEKLGCKSVLTNGD